MNKRSHGLFLDVSGIIAVGMVIYFIQMTTAVLPYLAKEFPQYSMTTIKLFATIPCFALVFCSPILNRLVQKFPIKNIALVGGCVMLLSGLACYITHNLIGILVLRCVFGIAYGILFPLASMLINQSYSGSQRATLMGLRSGICSLFTAGVVAIGGYLVGGTNWRMIFFGYLLIIPLLIWIAIFCPRNDPYLPTEKKGVKVGKWYTSKTWFLLIVMTLLNAFMMAFNVEVSLVIINGGLGNANDTSHVVMAYTIFAFLTGLVFGKINVKLKSYTLVLATLVAGCGYIVGSLAHGMGLMLAVGAMYGISFGMFHPVCNLLIASSAASQLRAPTAIAAYTCGMGIGQVFIRISSKLCGICSVCPAGLRNG